MTLHEAIKKVLLETKKRGLTAGEIALLIKRQKLYRIKGGKYPTQAHIHARVNKHPTMFKKQARANQRTQLILPVREPNMTLRDAIIKILLESNNRGLTAGDIAQQIRQRKLHRKRDKTFASASQVRACVNKFPHMFRKTDRVKGDQLIRMLHTPNMTLHAAIEKVLLDSDNRGLTVDDIEASIKAQDLYRKADGTSPSAKQIDVRISKQLKKTQSMFKKRTRVLIYATRV